MPRIFFAPSVDADAWPADDSDDGRPDPDELDDDGALELDDEYWDALLLDDDYEPTPSPATSGPTKTPREKTRNPQSAIPATSSPS